MSLRYAGVLTLFASLLLGALAGCTVSVETPSRYQWAGRSPDPELFFRVPAPPRELRMFAGYDRQRLTWHDVIEASLWAEVILVASAQDDPVAFQVQRALVEDYTTRWPWTTLSVEGLARDVQPALDQYRESSIGAEDFSAASRAAQWIGAYRWSRNYQPTIDAAVANGSPLLAPAAPLSLVRLAMEEGTDALRRLPRAERRLVAFPHDHATGDDARARFAETLRALRATSPRPATGWADEFDALSPHWVREAGMAITLSPGNLIVEGRDTPEPWGAVTRWIDVDLDRHPIVEITVQNAEGPWALKLMDDPDGQEHILQNDTNLTGTFTYSVPEVTGWAGEKRLQLRLYTAQRNQPVTIDAIRFIDPDSHADADWLVAALASGEFDEDALFTANAVMNATIADSILRALRSRNPRVVYLGQNRDIDRAGQLVREIRARRGDIKLLTVSLVPAYSTGLRDEDFRRADIVVYTQTAD